MESKEYVTYSRRAKAVERPSTQQSSLFKNDNPFHGYRSTKQWVEEACQQCRGGSIDKPGKQPLYQSEGAPKGLNATPCRTRTRKKDGRGVHFKQENDQTKSLVECKVNQASSLSPAIIVRNKDAGFPDSQAAALAPISLNVAVSSRQATISPVPAKYSPAAAAELPKGVAQTQGQVSVISPDGRTQTLPSGGDEEARQVVWCNPAFEADDDLRSHKSHDSVRSNRYSPASCSRNVESGISGFTNQNQDQQVWASGISNVGANPSAIFSQENFSYNPAISGNSAVVGSSPAKLVEKSPEQNCRLPPVIQLELESTPGEWYTPMGSEAGEFSSNSRNFAQGYEKPIDLSQTRRTVAASPSFKPKASPTLSHPNRHVPGSRGRSSSCTNSRKYPKYFTEVPSNYESDKRKRSNPRACVSYDNDPRNNRRTGGITILAGKTEPPRNCTPKIQRFQGDPMVEEDLEADIEHEIEQEISMEILQLSERLAALHAKQQTRRVAAGVEQERPKSGGISCPQTPTRNAPSPCGSDSTKRRKGRVVAAKFLQYTNDATQVKRDKSVNRTERPAAKLLGFSDGPFLGRPNPPRRSLGTPSRLLTKGKPNGQQRSSSPIHMMKERTVSRPADSEEQSRGVGATTVPYEEYVRSRALLESGRSKRVARVLSHKNLEEEDRKEWNDRGFSQQVKKKESQPASTLCVGSTTMPQPHFYPEFERKVDWVKTLRSDPIPAAHLCGTTNSPAPALDERFLKQKSERQDVRAWLQENIGVVEGNCEIRNFPPHASGTAIYEAGLQRGVQADVGKMRTTEEEDSTISTRPSNAWTSSLSNARAATPNRCFPNRPTTPSRGNARTVPSRYGTPVKVVPYRDHPGNKPIVENPAAKTWCSQTTPSKRYSKDAKGGLPMRKASPTIRKGYPAESAVRNEAPIGSGYGALKDERGLAYNNQGERKITVVEAEYEKFVQENVQIGKRGPVVSENTVVDGGRRGLGANQEIRSKTPSLIRDRDMPDPPGSATKPAKKIFIRCSELIKDKHSMLVKGKQRRLAGLSVLPSEGLDSDDSVFARSNTRTDLPELDGYNSRSEEASIIEECTYIKDCQHSPRRAVEGVPFLTGPGSCRSWETATPEYDIVYNYESGIAKGSSYRPEDYTLEMMLQYVDTLKCERESLPRIRAIKDGGTGSGSPRDSGCIKRRKEGENRARYYFNAGGEANKVQVPKCASIDNDGLSPNEIEGLDLESFWCLVGEPQLNLI